MSQKKGELDTKNTFRVDHFKDIVYKETLVTCVSKFHSCNYDRIGKALNCDKFSINRTEVTTAPYVLLYLRYT
jgi:hypothetical protein